MARADQIHRSQVSGYSGAKAAASESSLEQSGAYHQPARAFADCPLLGGLRRSSAADLCLLAVSLEKQVPITARRASEFCSAVENDAD